MNIDNMNIDNMNIEELESLSKRIRKCINEKKGKITKLFGYDIECYSRKEFSPVEGSYVLVKLEDTVSGKVNIRSSFYEGGTFWENDSVKSNGLETYCTDHSGNLIYNWRIEEWGAIIF